MRTRKVMLAFDFRDDGETIELEKISLAACELTPGEQSGLGEEIGQTDRWQVDHWNDIQRVLGGSTREVIYGRDF